MKPISIRLDDTVSDALMYLRDQSGGYNLNSAVKRLILDSAIQRGWSPNVQIPSSETGRRGKETIQPVKLKPIIQTSVVIPEVWPAKTIIPEPPDYVADPAPAAALLIVDPEEISPQAVTPQGVNFRLVPTVGKTIADRPAAGTKITAERIAEINQKMTAANLNLGPNEVPLM